MNNTRKTIDAIKALGIPLLHAQENESDPGVYAELKLLGIPDWQWYVTECGIDGVRNEVLFYGYVCGFENEWGYFNLSELEKMRTTLLINKKFYPAPFSVVKKAFKL